MQNRLFIFHVLNNCYRLKGHVDISGAVQGAHEQVVNFFKKSKLDREKLSKIWALSDVNEDGYLDFAEFSIAMHLVVLYVKVNASRSFI